MKYREDYIASHDLDIFFSCENPFSAQGKDKKRKLKGTIFVHCATFGAMLPEGLNDEDEHRRIVNEVSQLSVAEDLDSEVEIEVFTENIEAIIGRFREMDFRNREAQIRAYQRTFVKMAMKGFWSFDRVHSPNSLPTSEGDVYEFLLIAKPKADKPIDIDLPNLSNENSQVKYQLLRSLNKE